MRTATDLLVQYAEYHRDQRNITSHLIGVPLIVFAVGVLLSRPSFVLEGMPLSPAWLAFSVAAAWYMTRGQVVLGAAVSLGVGVLILLAQRVSDGGGFLIWATWGIGVFALGWAIQFAGHWYEGRKPAFVDDVIGLLVGPMFVVAELMFMAGWNKPLLSEIERRVGPTRLRDLAKIA